MMKNNEEIILQIPTGIKEAIQIPLSVNDTEKYTPDSKELDLIKNKCIEITKSNNVSVMYLDF